MNLDLEHTTHFSTNFTESIKRDFYEIDDLLVTIDKLSRIQTSVEKYGWSPSLESICCEEFGIYSAEATVKEIAHAAGKGIVKFAKMLFGIIQKVIGLIKKVFSKSRRSARKDIQTIAPKLDAIQGKVLNARCGTVSGMISYMKVLYSHLKVAYQGDMDFDETENTQHVRTAYLNKYNSLFPSEAKVDTNYKLVDQIKTMEEKPIRAYGFTSAEKMISVDNAINTTFSAVNGRLDALEKAGKDVQATIKQNGGNTIATQGAFVYVRILYNDIAEIRRVDKMFKDAIVAMKLLCEKYVTKKQPNSDEPDNTDVEEPEETENSTQEKEQATDRVNMFKLMLDTNIVGDNISNICNEIERGCISLEHLVAIRNTISKHGCTKTLMSLYGDNNIEFSVEGIGSAIKTAYEWIKAQLKKLWDFVVEFVKQCLPWITHVDSINKDIKNETRKAEANYNKKTSHEALDDGVFMGVTSVTCKQYNDLVSRYDVTVRNGMRAATAKMNAAISNPSAATDDIIMYFTDLEETLNKLYDDVSNDNAFKITFTSNNPNMACQACDSIKKRIDCVNTDIGYIKEQLKGLNKSLEAVKEFTSTGTDISTDKLVEATRLNIRCFKKQMSIAKTLVQYGTRVLTEQLQYYKRFNAQFTKTLR